MAANADRSCVLFEEFHILTGNSARLEMVKLATGFSPSDIEPFFEKAIPIWDRAQKNLFGLLSITKPPFSEEETERLLLRLVADLNGTLPIQHPFALILVREVKRKSLIITVISRSSIPGIHDCLSPKMAALMVVNERKDVPNPKVRKISLVRFPEEELFA